MVPHLWLRRHLQLAHLGKERGWDYKVVYHRPGAAGCADGADADAGAGARRAARRPAVHNARAHVLAELQEQGAVGIVRAVRAVPRAGCLPGFPVGQGCHARVQVAADAGDHAGVQGCRPLCAQVAVPFRRLRHAAALHAGLVVAYC